MGADMVHEEEDFADEAMPSPLVSWNGDEQIVWTVLPPLKQAGCSFTQWRMQQKTARESKISQSEQPLSYYWPKWNHIWMCVYVSMRNREGMLYVQRAVACVCEWVKLLHSTLGLLPNGCHPACNHPPAHPSSALKTLERKGEKTRKREQKSRGKGLISHRQVRTCRTVPSFTNLAHLAVATKRTFQSMSLLDP